MLNENELPEGVADVLNKRGTDSVREVLEERGKVHGRIQDNARLTCILYDTVGSAWDSVKSVPLSSTERLCLHMICHKLARFTTGDHENSDHLVDLMGYSQLLIDHIENEKWKGE